MLIIEQTVLSLVMALVCAAVPWLARRLRSWLLAVGLLLGIVVSLLATLLGISLYPWSNLVVLLMALTGGLLLGRGMPPRFQPFLVVLLVLSVLDVVQIVLSGGFISLPSSPPAHSVPTPSGALLYLDIFLRLPQGHYTVGIFDPLVIAAAAEHWRRRGQSYLIALLPGVLGFLLVYGMVALTQRGGWPLIPFITTGWLVSELVSRGRSRQVPPTVAKQR
jgi:hypothetical protein